MPKFGLNHPTNPFEGVGSSSVAHWVEDDAEAEGSEGGLEDESARKDMERKEHVLREYNERLRLIAHSVSGDYTMVVEPGEPGKWYWDTRNNVVRWDPLEVLEKSESSEDELKGKIAHEGGHRAVTRYFGFVPDEVMSQVGMSSLLASVEERPTDQVVRERFSGAGRWVDAARQGSVREGEEAVRKLRESGRDLGYVPRFRQLCSLIVYQPQYRERPEDVDADVWDFYENSQDLVERIEKTLPPEGSTEDEVVDYAIERYRLTYRELWPRVQEFVGKDLEDERMRQTLLDELRDLLNGSKNPEDSSLPPELLKELLKAILERLQEQKKDESDNEGESEREGKEDSDGESEDGDDDDDDEPFGKPTSESPEKEVQSEEGDTDSVEEEGQDDVDGMLKKLKTKLEEKTGKPLDSMKENIPVPMDKLSPEIKQAAKQMHQDLPERTREDMAEKARKSMENAEDQVVEQMGAKLMEGAETHEEQQRRLEIEAEEAEERAERERRKNEEEERERKELEEIQKKIDESSGNAGEYEKAYREIHELDEELFREMSEIFRPNLKDKVSLRSTGTRLNLPAVFRWQAAKKGGAKNVDTRIFESLVRPETKDYAVTLLVDLSGSMSNKIQETFQAVVLLTEVLNRLGIKIEVIGFQDELIPLLEYGQILDDTARKRIGGMLSEVQDVNPDGHNKSSYNDDGPCLSEASERLKKQDAKEKIMIVLSDGQPCGRRSGAWHLHHAIKRILTSTDQKLLAVGLGQGTEHVGTYYPFSAPNIDIKQLAEKLGALIRDVILHPDAFKYKNV